MKKIIIAAAAIAAATPALAQDETAPFGGFRVEARAGLDRPTVSLEATDGVDSIEESEGKSGVVYGGEIGYDVQVSSSAFVGGYAGIEGATTKACTEVYGGDEACIKAGRNITVGARVGVTAGGNTAIYAKGGYSNGRLNLTYEDPAFPADNFEEGGNLDGFHLGAGVEFAMSSGVYAKLEYVYSNYGDYDYADGVARASLGLDRHQAVAGVGFRF